jgi:hypothetical protein
MTATAVVLIAHIALGIAGIVLGPVAMFARKLPGLHTRAGEVYHWVMLGVCVSAGMLAILDWGRIWWFFLVAAGSYAFALLGYVAAKRPWNGWLRAHITGQGGSYIAMVTAVLIVNWETLTGIRGVASPWAWALPTVVGQRVRNARDGIYRSAGTQLTLALVPAAPGYTASFDLALETG